jgi:hypothetical protein
MMGRKITDAGNLVFGSQSGTDLMFMPTSKKHIKAATSALIFMTFS